MFTFDLAAEAAPRPPHPSPALVAHTGRAPLLAIVAGDELDPSGASARGAAARLVTELTRLGGPAPSAALTRERLECALLTVALTTAAPANKRTRSGLWMIALTFAERHAVLGRLGAGMCSLLRLQNLRSALAPKMLTNLDWTLGAPLSLGDAELGLAGGFAPQIQATEAPFEEGDVYVLHAPSLWHALSPNTIARALITARTARHACKQLQGAFAEAGAPAEFGAAVVRLVPDQLSKDKPPFAELEAEAERPRENLAR